MSASKPFFTVTQCCCPRGKSLSLSSRTNLQVLVIEPQVLEYNTPYDCDYEKENANVLTRNQKPTGSQFSLLHELN